jgi:hypothetical protein
MKQKQKIDLSSIHVTRADTDADLLIKVRQAMPELLRSWARQVGRRNPSEPTSYRSRQRAMKGARNEQARSSKEREQEFLRELTADTRKEFAERVFQQLKDRRDLLPPA